MACAALAVRARTRLSNNIPIMEELCVRLPIHL